MPLRDALGQQVVASDGVSTVQPLGIDHGADDTTTRENEK